MTLHETVRRLTCKQEAGGSSPSRPSDPAQNATWACARAGFIPRVAFESDEYLTIQQLVAAGVGVALVPGLAMRFSPVPSTAVVPLGSPVVRRVMAAVHAPEFRAPAAGAMLEILREVAVAGDEER